MENLIKTKLKTAYTKTKIGHRDETNVILKNNEKNRKHVNPEKNGKRVNC